MPWTWQKRHRPCRYDSLADLAGRLGAHRHAGVEILFEQPQIVAQILGRLIAVVRILGQAAPEDPSDVTRQVLAQFGDRRGCVLDDGRQDRHVRVALERLVASGHLEQQDAEREDVRARVDWLALCLFRRHVGDRAHDASVAGDRRGGNGGREAVEGRFFAQLGEAEIQYLHAAFVGDHDVGGLQVTMGDTPLVCGADGVGQRDAHLQQLVERHALPADDLGQRLADHQLHRQEGHAVLLVDGIDRDDVGVVQRGNRPRLALEAAAALRIVRHGLGQDLQRDPATELGVLGQQDLAHAA